MMKYISVYLDEELVEKIEDKAKREERSRNFMIGKILRDFFQ